MSETETAASVNPTLTQIVGTDTKLKEWLVNYVGQQQDEENKSGDITVEMIVETVSKEFPEFLMAVAEENFLRGYQQAMNDMFPDPAPGGYEPPPTPPDWIDPDTTGD